MHDQDSLNYVFKGQWFRLSPKWNKNAMAISILDSKAKFFDKYEFTYQPKIIHFAGDEKPWYNLNFPNRKYYVHYLKLSGYPNPIFSEISTNKKIKLIKNIVKYYVNRYIHPFVPDIIEVILNDIVMMTLFFISILNPQLFKIYILKRWLKKY